MKRTIVFSFMILLTAALYAAPTLNVFKISGNGVDEQTLSNISDVLYTFLAEAKDYSTVDCRMFSSPDATGVPSAEYCFYGSIVPDKSDIKMDLILKNLSTGTTRLLSKVYSNANLILLESKSLLQKLLDQNYEISNTVGSVSATDVVIVSDSLSGTWLGEEDIKSIKLLQNGRGVIIFKNGLSLSVDFTEKSGVITIVQKGNITERQFPNLPKELAVEAVKKAQPTVWVLEGDTSKLTGTRTATVVMAENGKISTVTRESINVIWTKLE